MQFIIDNLKTIVSGLHFTNLLIFIFCLANVGVKFLFALDLIQYFIGSDSRAYGIIQAICIMCSTYFTLDFMLSKTFSLFPSSKARPLHPFIISCFSNIQFQSRANVGLNKTCSICLNDFKNNEILMVFACAHNFHQACIKPWFAWQSKCPNCKKEITFSKQQWACLLFCLTTFIVVNITLFLHFKSYFSLVLSMIMLYIIV